MDAQATLPGTGGDGGAPVETPKPGTDAASAPKPSGRGGARPGAGAKPKQVAVLDYLRSNGLIAVPAGTTPSTPGQSPSPAAVPPAVTFDEARCRVGASIIVESYRSSAKLAAEQIASFALGDEQLGKKFGPFLSLSDDEAKVCTDAVVEYCREENVQLSAGAALIAVSIRIGGGWTAFSFQMWRLYKERRELESKEQNPDAKETKPV